MTAHKQNCESGCRRPSVRTAFTSRYGAGWIRMIPTSARHSINCISYPTLSDSRTVTPVPRLAFTRIQMPLVRTPLRIHRNLYRLPNKLRRLRGSLASSFLGLVRVPGNCVHGEIARNTRDTVSAKTLPETDRHHAGCGAFHERSVGGYGRDEDRECHLEL